jgi:hypothetical protein
LPSIARHLLGANARVEERGEDVVRLASVIAAELDVRRGRRRGRAAADSAASNAEGREFRIVGRTYCSFASCRWFLGPSG